MGAGKEEEREECRRKKRGQGRRYHKLFCEGCNDAKLGNEELFQLAT